MLFAEGLVDQLCCDRLGGGRRIGPRRNLRDGGCAFEQQGDLVGERLRVCGAAGRRLLAGEIAQQGLELARAGVDRVAGLGIFDRRVDEETAVEIGIGEPALGELEQSD